MYVLHGGILCVDTQLAALQDAGSIVTQLTKCSLAGKLGLDSDISALCRCGMLLTIIVAGSKVQDIAIQLA